MTALSSRKVQFRWNSSADLCLLKIIAAERPTTTAGWQTVAVNINAQPGMETANVDKRGCKDRFTRILIPNFKAKDSENSKVYVLV